MTVFLRLMADADKETALADCCEALRGGGADARVFDVAPEAFKAVPGAPFAYWIGEAIRQAFLDHPRFEREERVARQGGVNGDDFRWLRIWFECSGHTPAFDSLSFVSILKGGSFSEFYADPYLVARWSETAQTFFSFNGLPHRPSLQPASFDFYFRPGLTWPRRTNGLSFRVMPRGCIFADKGPAVFVAEDDPKALLALCALVNSRAFGLLVSLQLARTELAQSYEVGLIQQTPVPDLTPDQEATLAAMVWRAWSLKRTLDTVEETSHAFLLPAPLRPRLGDCDPPAITAELADIQAEIDALAFDLYGFSDEDRVAAGAPVAAETATETEAPTEPLPPPGGGWEGGETTDAPDRPSASTPPQPSPIQGREPDPDDDDADDDAGPSVADTDALLSWAVGVAFGRFDIRLATGERAAPPEPGPFDPLPAKSPGMLPDGDPPFHAHTGILVDDAGHPHDLAHLIDRVLGRVGVEGPDDTRAWLRRSFFPLHLRQYSKSRRKAPIYWPLSTASGDYTLWLYYPAITDQTLFIAANDFVGAKLDRQVDPALRALRQKTDRSRAEERELEALDTLETELRALRDELLRLAPTWRPNHDDGVQITAAPLWRLFRHRPWQTVLRDTWDKLEAGDYDWAHLAMTYWPDRVREKCRSDKSLAIAHDLEDLYQPPPEAPTKTKAKGGRGRKKKG